MLWGHHAGGLELRKRASGAMALRGRFPYNSLATLSDGGRNGRPQKEQFAPGAFRFSVESDADILFLSGHRFDKPLASRAAGTLELSDTPEALLMEAEISAEIAETTWARDFMAAFSAGLVVGLSPGFRIPPERAAKNAVIISDENPTKGTAIIRTVREAILVELSAVTRAAYPEAQISARGWGLSQPKARPLPALARWRA